MDDTFMKGLSDALVCGILQFAQEATLTSFTNKLLQETSVFFDIKYFKEQICYGEWDIVEGYLEKFTVPKDGYKSAKILYMLKKHKFLEALANNNVEEALHVFESELQAVFKDSYPKWLEKLSKILEMKKPSNSKMVSQVKDIKASRTQLGDETAMLIKNNRMFKGKLELPTMEKSRLLQIVMQGMEWQHTKCTNPRDKPEFSSIYVDHSCKQRDEAPALVNDQVVAPVKSKSAAGGKSKGKTATTVKRKSVSRKLKIGTTSPEKRRSSRKLKERITQQMKRKSSSEKQNEKYPCVSKRKRGEEASDHLASDNVLQTHNPQQNGCITDELPLNVVMSLACNSTIDSMDFHPSSETLLLYGTQTGNVFLWELRGKKKLSQDSYRLWNVTNSDKVKTADGSPPGINRVKWSPGGGYFAVAYTNCILHIYAYLDDSKLQKLTEIEAHEGNVFDVTFITTDDELCLVTCGEDRTIKVWEAFTGTLKRQFNGFKESVCSVYAHQFNDYPAIYAADTSGIVTILSYNDEKGKIRITLPHRISSMLALSAEGPRLFAGGTNKDPESCIVELSLTDHPKVKHSYDGLVSPAKDYVYYDIVNGKYLAAVDEFKIKFWELGNTSLLKTINARTGKNSCIKFNGKGTLLAVATKDNRIKILANAAGKKVLQPKGKRVLDASTAAAAEQFQNPNVSLLDPLPELGAPRRCAFRSPIVRNNIGSCSMLKPMDSSRIQMSNEINDFEDCISLRIPNTFSRGNVQVSCLAYTKSGRAILVLGSNGEHKLWEWQKSVENPNGKATPKSEPKHWQAPEEVQMVNDVGYANPEGRISCFALPKNRYYVLSTSGGNVAVYDITTFKTIAKVMTPPPAATALAIHPNDSNTLIFGTEDSSIQIYQFRTRQVSLVLCGHTKRITGLAFSVVLNVLVSSGADSQLCIWTVDKWEKLGSTILKVPRGRTSDTRIQFHNDQKHLLAVHKTQIAIYSAPELKYVNKWTPKDADILITHAAYSCDSESIFVAFQNGNVGVFTAMSLDLKCTINQTSFLPPSSGPMPQAYPRVVAAHPSEANQFALGLTDGMVVLLEPKKGTWVTPSADENGAGPSGTPGIVDLDELVWFDDSDEEEI